MYRKNAAMKVKAFDFDIKAVNDDGLFSGYGSVFDVVDSYNEVVAPGAFLESIMGFLVKALCGWTTPPTPKLHGEA